MARIYVGSYGALSIQEHNELQSRLDTLRRRTDGPAKRKPAGRKIFEALVHWEMETREAICEQHHVTVLEEYRSYELDTLPMEALEEAERLNAEGQAAARAQGPTPTYPCRMHGCQHRTRVQGSLCPQCQHDEE